MFFDVGRLVIVKHYFWISLAIAILPLLFVAGLYDYHSSQLRDRLLLERINSDLQTTFVQTNNFINKQNERLSDIVDLPEIATVLTNDLNQKIAPELLDLIYSKIEDTDVYSLLIYGPNGMFIRSFPPFSSQLQINIENLSDINARETEDIQLVLPGAGYPGWLLIKKPVERDNNTIGIVGLKIRLASMTEQAAPLFLKGVYEPLFLTPNNGALSIIGHSKTATNIIAESENFLPGWSIALQSIGNIDNQLSNRFWLLFIVLVSAFGVIWSFLNFSKRIARMITPLKDGAQAIANGDLTTLVDESGVGELGSLARAFNDMSRQLTKMIATRVYADKQASIGILATGIAHEIRNPLSTINTTVHGLLTSEKDHDRREMLKVISGEVIRTDSIVEEFMNYARPREPHKTIVLVDEVFQKIIVLISASALKNNIKISKLGDVSVKIFVDPGHFSQILMNIVLNSIQAMPDGGHITLRAHRENDNIYLKISDTGNGIPSDQLEKIQVPFYTTKAKGTGLGLSICAQLINVNNGSLDIDSDKGKGTVVTIAFPEIKL
jgi:two-component system sensor histidine kinase AtoS